MSGWESFYGIRELNCTTYTLSSIITLGSLVFRVFANFDSISQVVEWNNGFEASWIKKFCKRCPEVPKDT